MAEDIKPKDIIAELPDGTQLHFPAGTLDTVIDNVVQSHIQNKAQPAPEEPNWLQRHGISKERFKQEFAPSNLAKDVGIAARGAIQGGGSILDLLAAPVRGAANLALPESQQIKPMSIGQTAANALNLPTAGTPAQRISEKVFEGAGSTVTPYGLANIANKTAPLFNAVPKTGVGETMQNVGTALREGFGKNLPQQIQAGMGAGAGVGTVQELGGNQWLQLLAGLAGGIATPTAIKYGAQPLMESVATKAQDFVSSFKAPVINPNIDKKIGFALSSGDIKLTDIPEGVLNSVRNDLSQITKNGEELSTDAVRRLIDYRMTGAIPKKGTLTLNPKDITLEKNLSKMGAGNLADVENANNQTLINNLNGLGAANAAEPQVVGETLFNKFKTIHDQNQQKINELYTNAKTKDGRLAEYDSFKFTNDINNGLENNLKTKFVPTEIKSMVNDFATGKVPLNVQTKVQFQSIVSDAMRSTMDGNVKSALKVIRDNLESVPLKAGQEFGADADAAFKAANRYTYNYKKTQEQIPALKAVEDGVSADTFFNKYIINSDAKTFEKTFNQLDAEGQKVIKDNIVGFIKNKATNNVADETAKISGSQLDKAIAQLGTKKLNLLFSSDELAQLKAIRNVAKFEQFQPTGSAVNTSNTATTLMNLSNAGLNVVRPLIRGFQANQAMDISQAFKQPNIPQVRKVISPYSTTFGLLNNQNQQ